ncbi:MAG: hypothetical protein D6814_07080 [Calditrichaeota bacterium]|nr:MAG: hypothetical protein D6814_07080 [Calditrichota bacterium]
MRVYFQKAGRLLSLALLLIAAGCSKSPFGNSDIASAPSVISGQIALNSADDPAGVYVWLEGTALSTRTDAMGEYQFSLPASGNGLFNNIDGSFRLWFYVANYRLASAEVLIRDGQFVFSRGDVDAKGHLLRPHTLLKTLAIETAVSPAAVPSDYSGLISVDVALWALGDSVTVLFPKVVSGGFGALLLHHLDSDSVFVQNPNIDAQSKLVAKVGEDRRHWEMVFRIEPGMLPTGKYEIIPFLLIQQEDLPPELIRSLGEHVEEFGASYLKIPFKRSGGLFEIQLAN